MPQCYFSRHGIKHIDYKDIDLLKKFIDAHGRIMPRRKTSVSSLSQRKLQEAIKRARFMALIPYIERF